MADRRSHKNDDGRDVAPRHPLAPLNFGVEDLYLKRSNQRVSRFASIAWSLTAFLISAGASGWLSMKLRTEAPSAEALSQTPGANAESQPEPTLRRGFSSDEEMLASVMSAVAQDQPLLRAHQLHETLGRLNSAELSALFDKAVQVKNDERRQPLLGALLARWIAVDREAASTAVRPYQDRFRSTARIDWRSLDTIVSRTWAELVPEETLTEAMASPDTRWARDLASVALSSLADGEDARKLEKLSLFPDGRLRGELCASAIRALAEKDYAAAESHLGLLTDPRMRARMQAEILGVLAKRDPSSGLARLTEMAPNLPAGLDGIRLVTEVLSAASKKDPEASLAAVDNLPSSLRSQALGSVLVGWADEHPIDALKWSAAHGMDPSEAKRFSFSDGAVSMSWRTLLMVAFDRDNEKTLDWIRTQPASAQRDSMLSNGLWNGTLEQKLQCYDELTPAGQADEAGQLVRFSLRYDGASESKTESWVNAQPPGAARSAAIQALAGYQAESNTGRADDLVQAWAPGPDRDAALRGIASSLANRDPLSALEYARQVSDSGARESAYEKVAQSWFYQDKSAARTWITRAPELSAEQKRVLLRQADEQ
jgi:hypothetical protein